MSGYLRRVPWRVACAELVVSGFEVAVQGTYGLPRLVGYLEMGCMHWAPSF